MNIEKVCLYCGKKFIVTYKERNRKYCCSNCYNNSRIINRKNKYICSWCGTTFFGRKKKYRHTYCSKKCYHLSKKYSDLRAYYTDDNFFKQDTKESFWLLGMLASDGCVSTDGKFIKISQSGEEGLRCVCYIKDLLKSTAPINQYYPKVGKEVNTLTINSPIMVRDLQKYNIVPQKTNIFVPSSEILMSKFFRYFLWGYIDGDGCVGVYKCGSSKNLLNVSFVCTKEMADSILPMLPYEPKYYKQNNVWCIYYNGERAYYFLNWLFNDPDRVYISYKYLKYREYCDKYLQKQKFYKYGLIYNQCVKLFEEQKDLTCMDIGRLLKIPFQTIYTYKHRWEKEKCMKNVTPL